MADKLPTTAMSLRLGLRRVTGRWLSGLRTASYVRKWLVLGGKGLMFADGDTVLSSGDVVSVFTRRGDEQAVRQLLGAPAPSSPVPVPDAGWPQSSSRWLRHRLG